MRKVTLSEASTTALVVGAGAVVPLLLGAATYNPPAHGTPLEAQLWWRSCVAIFSALMAAGVLGFVLPQFQGLRFRVPWQWMPTVNHSSSRIHGWKDPSIWKRVEPTMPPGAGASPAINAAQSGPVFAFEVALGNSQEIEFEIPLRINLKGVLQLAVGEEERYAADVYIDCPAARIEPAHETAEISPHHFYIPKSANGTVYGFAAGFITFAELPNRRKSFRIFSIGVTHVNPTRGVVTFLVLCYSWYVEHG
jgi:hypothetical protein